MNLWKKPDPSPRKKICFFALNAYPIFSGKYENSPGEIGGAELQQSIIGRELAKNLYDVSFIVFNNNNPATEMTDSVTFYKTINKNHIFSGIRSYIIAFKSIWAALCMADADWYYQRGADTMTGIVSLFCIIHRRKFVFALANDMDINGTFFKEFRLLSKILYFFGLNTADSILVQTQYQKTLLKSAFNREGIAIKNVTPVTQHSMIGKKRPVVLWVSTIRSWKQPELFLQLAKSLPDISFQMVGGPAKDSKAGIGVNDLLFQKIQKKAERIPNLTFSGFIPYNEIDRVFFGAAVFVNTSSYEGYPNTFLQAWSYNVPVISLNVDPDEVICSYKLGHHSKTFNQMVLDVNSLMNNENDRLEFGKNGREYVEKEHTIDRIIPQYFAIFQ